MGKELSQRVPIVNILHTQQVKTPLLVKAQDFGEFGMYGSSDLLLLSNWNVAPIPAFAAELFFLQSGVTVKQKGLVRKSSAGGPLASPAIHVVHCDVAKEET
jgi:hypothetical protein